MGSALPSRPNRAPLRPLPREGARAGTDSLPPTRRHRRATGKKRDLDRRGGGATVALSAADLSYAPPGADFILRDLSLQAGAGQVLGILGPNGAGKSSLLRLFYGMNRPTKGTARIGDTDVERLSASRRARLVAAVPQESPPDFHLSVRDVVETGRTAHFGPLLGRDPKGPAAVAGALERLGLSDLAERGYATLSGGEKRRALIARAVAQESQALILDEPVNHLDIRHKLEVMALIRRLGVTVMVSLHDFDLAARFCDRLAILHRGSLVAEGSPADVLLPETVREVFGVAATIVRDDARGTLRVFTETLPAGQDPRR